MYNATKDDNISSLKSSAKNIRNVASEAADEAAVSLSDAANKAGRKLRDVLENAETEFTHAKDKVTTQIRSNPVQSSMVALGVGFIIGALLRRR